MPVLDRIKIAGFKSIREIDLKLNQLNVLIGANGSGKSNFISVFRLLHEMVEERLQLFVGRSGGADNLLHFGRKHTERIALELSFGANSYDAALAPSESNSLVFEREACLFRGDYKPLHPMRLGSGHEESKVPRTSERSPGRVASHVLEALKSWQVYHFHDTSPEAKVKQLGNIDDVDFLRPDASNLAAFLLSLKQEHEDSYLQIRNTVRMAAPFFHDFKLRPYRNNKEKIQLEWTERGAEASFNAHTLSDGTLRFICLATLLLQPEPPSTILIDEPELGLHPYAITLLASLLRGATSGFNQVIASTQSVTLVNQLSPDDIVVVEREGGASVFRRLKRKDVASWLDDYGLGDLWEKNVFGGRPKRAAR